MGLALQELDMRDHGGHQRYSPLQGYMTFLDTLHVEANGGDRAMARISAWTGLMVARSRSIETLMEHCRRCLHDTEQLLAYSTVNSPP